jgi:hypothetical protein
MDDQEIDNDLGGVFLEKFLAELARGPVGAALLDLASGKRRIRVAQHPTRAGWVVTTEEVETAAGEAPGAGARLARVMEAETHGCSRAADDLLLSRPSMCSRCLNGPCVYGPDFEPARSGEQSIAAPRPQVPKREAQDMGKPPVGWAFDP